MIKICKNCQSQFDITRKDSDFYELFKVPEPLTCPDCRLLRRLQERNIRKLYRRKCDATGKKIISQYHKDQPFPVYHPKIWWSDAWDALDYGQNYDPHAKFFDQFKSLKNKVPHMGTYVIYRTMTNSDYTNCAGYVKNCYLSFEVDHNEDCYYCNRVYNCNNLVDCFTCYKTEMSYECSDCQNCYNLKYSKDCEHCTDSYFLHNCKSCENCIACVNLRHKKYHIFNEPCSKEEYEILEAKLKTSRGIEELMTRALKFFQTQPHKNLQEEHNENCTGDYLYHSKNATFCFDCDDLEDCRYCHRVSLKVKSSMDYTAWGDQAELLYQCVACGDNAYNLKFCTTCTTNNSALEYCDHCTGCQNCFGCVGLKRKKYCILNKQYSKEEYKLLCQEIIDEMDEYGEFFPLEICPFAYNESLAMEYFPLSKEEVLKKGFKWKELSVKNS